MANIVKNGVQQLQDIAGSGGDKKIHQIQHDPLYKDVHDKDARITSDWGVKSSNTDDWLKVATEDKTGPMLLEDSFAREKIHRFDHERIPERVVHARGTGAFGTFKLHESAKDVTSAGVLTDTSRETPVFVRFSTVQGPRGSADTVRDVRGFAVKLYTEEGNWDIVGNDMPVFFIQDSMKFPDLVHAVKPEPHNEVPTGQTAHSNAWDFFTMHSEATHMFMWAMSDRGIPRSYRMMQGFGVNTYILVNEAGKRSFVKFHFTPELGVHSLVWDEALKITGQDPDFHRKDLEEAIQNQCFPRWRFGIQIIPEEKENDFEFDILDATKFWPEDQIPIRYIGTLELNRNPDEYFTQVEQVAFCTSHVVPGIGFSDDPLLQGRNFSYFDTQISRLGINWQELPINRPVCPVMNHHRDGAMRHTTTKGKVNYWPNRFEAAPPANAQEGGYVDYPAKVNGLKQRMRSAKFRDHHSQAQLFYNSLSEHEKAHVISALAFELSHCEEEIVYQKNCERLAEIDMSLAQSVAEQVGATLDGSPNIKNHGKRATGLSQMDFLPATPTIESRRIAILIADGFDMLAFSAAVEAIRTGGGFPTIIGPRRNPVKSADGDSVKPQHHFEDQRSTLYDALFIPGGSKSVDTLKRSGRTIHWIREAFGHLKAIAATGEAVELVRHACNISNLDFSTDENVVNHYGVVTLARAQAQSFTDTVRAVKGAKDFFSVYFYEIGLHRNWKRELDGLSASVAY